MNSSSIFLRRLRENQRYKRKVWRTVADWTVVVYIIIPAILIGIFRFISWWQETPSWAEPLPLSIFFFGLFLLSWYGNIQTYVEEADKLFLVKKRKLFLGVKVFGYGYSLAAEALSTIAILIILSPILILKFNIGSGLIFLLFFYLFSFRSTILICKYYWKRIESRWIGMFTGICLFAVFGGIHLGAYSLFVGGDLLNFALAGLSLILLVGSVIVSYRALQRISTIDHDIKMGQDSKNSGINMIFTISQDVEKPVITKRKRPLLFRRSKRMFQKRTKANGFIELFIKAFIRNFSYWLSYFQMTSVGAAAIVVIPPMWIKSIIFFAYLFMMYTWLQSVWDKVFQVNPITKKYTEADDYFKARKRTILILYFIAILLLIGISSVGLFIYSSFSILYQMQ
ncbi:ABC transporter permease [Cytobacillus gottheilii]|uniref:ABC transporter permease n=1 Tax=Cytobacillus gottheilii TaxID=859144 RepID=UPI002494BA74|nr:ABC transporter permease [Cytobacillus gottheilii]